MKPAAAQSLRSGRRKGMFRWGSRISLLAGGILLAWCLYVWVDSRIYEKVEGEHFDAISETRSIISAPASQMTVIQPPSVRLAVGSVLGRIEIPRIGVSVMVLEGDTQRIFRRAAGHLEGTAAPGEPGNVVIAAHRDTFFRPLRNIHDEDIIKFTTVRQSFWYRVESVDVVGPDDLEVLGDSPQPILTLITCYPFYYVGPAPKRFIVRARQISLGSPAELGQVEGPDGTAQISHYDAGGTR